LTRRLRARYPSTRSLNEFNNGDINEVGERDTGASAARCVSIVAICLSRIAIAAAEGQKMARIGG
jgi:hypothetical protein